MEVKDAANEMAVIEGRNMIILPSCAELAARLRQQAEDLAKEIARRAAEDRDVERHAKDVLIDWLMGADTPE